MCGMGTRIGRPPKCGGCSKCDRCRRAAYMRERWARLTPEQRRAALDARDRDHMREQDRRKQAKRRAIGTPSQRLRIVARNEVRKAKLRGDLVPGPCEFAGFDCGGAIHAHHDDYTKPLEVRWICRAHHDRLHGLAA